MLNDSVLNSYSELLLPFFNSAMEQQGSMLYRLLSANKVIMDNTFKFREEDLSKPYWMENSGGDTQYGTISYDHRLMRAKDIGYSMLEDAYLIGSQGQSESATVARHAARMANKLQLFCEDFIINGKNGYGGIAGKVEKYAKNGTSMTSVSFDENNTIYAGLQDYGVMDAANDPIYSIRAGLNVGKLNAAEVAIRKNFVNSPMVVLASPRAMALLRSDERYANSNYNIQPAAISGQMNPVGSMVYFIESAYLKDGIQMHKADGTEAASITGEYAYVFAADQLLFGQKPVGDNTDWNLSILPDPSKNHNLSIMFRGSIDVARKTEKAFFRIEVANKSNTNKFDTLFV